MNDENEKLLKLCFSVLFNKKDNLQNHVLSLSFFEWSPTRNDIDFVKIFKKQELGNHNRHNRQFIISIFKKNKIVKNIHN